MVPSSSCLGQLGVDTLCGAQRCGSQPLASVPGPDGIYNGAPAKSLAWPWAAAVYSVQDPPLHNTRAGGVLHFRCAASVIAPRWLVTAQSCVASSATSLLVKAGSSRRSASSLQKSVVAGVLSPHNATGSLNNGDIALLYLADALDFSSTLAPVCLPRSGGSEPAVGAGAVSAGWGSLRATFGQPGAFTPTDDLEELSLSLAACPGAPSTLAGRDLCAAAASGNGSLCTLAFDQGDGLFLNSSQGWTLAGVASRPSKAGAFNCATVGSSTVFTSTTHYADWLQSTMECFESGAKWPCGSGGGCVGWASLCDGAADCADGSDEAACPSLGHCGPDAFRCKSKDCRPLAAWCDGHIDCPDGSDELPQCQTFCPDSGHSCDANATSGYRKCLSTAQLCDGVQDCRDGTDEEGCECGDAGSFRCGTGQCVAAALRCNGRADCADASDEAACQPAHCLANLPKAKRCDGVRDCPCTVDKYGLLICPDESNCCARFGQFHCPPTRDRPQGRCIDRSKHCDGFPDCPDGSDETSCLRTHADRYGAQLLYATVEVGGTERGVCGDAFGSADAAALCAAQGFRKPFSVYAAGPPTSPRAFSPGGVGSSSSWPGWWRPVVNCSSSVSVGRCGIPQCGLRLPFPSLYRGAEAAFEATEAQAQVTSAFVGALFYRNAFVCSGVLVDAIHLATSLDCLRRNAFAAGDWSVRLGFERLSGAANGELFGVEAAVGVGKAVVVLRLSRYAASSVGGSWPACQAPLDLRPAALAHATCVAIGWDLSAGRPNGTLDMERIPVRVETSALVCPTGFCVGHVGAERAAGQPSSQGLLGKVSAGVARAPCLGATGGVVLCQTAAQGPWWYVAQLRSGAGCLSAGPQPATFVPSLGHLTAALRSPGFGGSSLCSPNPCQNGGTCVSDGIDYLCSCGAGFQGLHCEHFSCGGFLRGPSGGSFASPSFPAFPYPPAADCLWTLIAPPGHFLQLSFPSFALPAPSTSGACSDSVTVYETWSLSQSSLLGRWCGAGPSQPIVSAGPSLTVRFTSDDQGQAKGFAAVYSVVSCGGSLRGAMGSVSSPGFPLGYPASANCTWTIASPSPIAINFTDITLEGGFLNDDCSGDYVSVFGQRLCKAPGKVLRPPAGDATAATIVFRSDAAESYGGFRLSWFPEHKWSFNFPSDQCASSPCGSGPNAVCTNTPGLSHACTCSPGYTGPDCATQVNLCSSSPCAHGGTCRALLDDFACVCSAGYEGRTCGELRTSLSLSGPSGTLASTNFPANYPNNLHFEWYITLPEGTQAQLLFSSFAVEAEPRCGWDSLSVYSGLPGSPSFGLLTTFCDAHKPPAKPFVVPASTLTLVFKTDGSGTERGFNATYLAVPSAQAPNPLSQRLNPTPGVGTPCNATLGSSGLLESPGYPQRYPNPLNCVWRIEAGIGGQVHISLLAMHIRYGSTWTEPCQDAFEVYEEGVLDSAHLVKNLTCVRFKSTSPFSYDSQTGSLAIVFRAGPTSLWSRYRLNTGFLMEYYTSSALCGAGYCLNGGTCSNGPSFAVCACPPGFVGAFCQSSTQCSPTLSTATRVGTGRSIQVASPGFPADYPEHASCYFALQTDPASVLHVTFTALALEKSYNGCYDYIAFSNTSSLSGQPRLCGHTLPPPTVSEGNQWFLQFYSDTSRGYSGFAATVTAAPDYCNRTFCQANEFCINSVNGSSCHCQPGWSGQRCDTQINLCLSSPCAHNGTCFPKLNGLTCACAEGWGGPGCEEDLVCGPTADPCQNGATCVRGGAGGTEAQCVCRRAFAGTYCQMTRCGGALSAAPNGGRLTSPDYPHYYPSGLHCEWIITATNGSSIVKLLFEKFYTNYYPHYDTLKLYDGLSEQGNLIKTLSGYYVSSSQLFFWTTGPVMSLVFDAEGDRYITGDGFVARYYSDSDACKGSQCNAHETCTNGLNTGDFSCVCRPHYSGHNCSTPKNSCNFNACGMGTCSNAPDTKLGFTCACPPGYSGDLCQDQAQHCSPNPCANGGTCHNKATGFTCACLPYFSGPNCTAVVCAGQRLGGASPRRPGSVSSPGFPRVDYPPNASCHWTISPVDSRMVTHLTLRSFRLEGPSKGTPACPYDYLQISNATQILYKECGLSQPQGASVVVGPGPVSLAFHSDDTVQAPGFAIDYFNVLPGWCNATNRQGSGIISSYGYPASLAPSSQCTFGLLAEPSSRVTLQLRELDLPVDHCQSYLAVYDFNKPAPWAMLGKLCGGANLDASTFVSSTNALTIVLQTGPAMGPHRGFLGAHTSEAVAGCAGKSCLGPDKFCAVVAGVARCQCYDGYYLSNQLACIQKTCGSFSDEIECANGGTCVSDLSLGPSCACPPGFSGRYCQIDTQCEASIDPCENGATCAHGASGAICFCAPGFTGPTCSVALPPYRCGGVVSSFPSLVSSPSARGGPHYPADASCEWTLVAPEGQVLAFHLDLLDLEESTDCAADSLTLLDSDGHTQIASICGQTLPSNVNFLSSGSRMLVRFASDATINDAGFSARVFPSANFCASKRCVGQSKCVNSLSGAQCVCHFGWQGPNCNTPVDLCAAFPCGNGGTCVDDVRAATASCVCAPGYTGAHCYTRLDHCLSQPCANGGTCINGLSKFTCQCADGFYGASCANPPCGGVVTSEQGQLSSPGFPVAYLPGSNCTWHLQGRHRHIFRLRILSLTLEGPRGNCLYDYLKIYDGPDESWPLLESLCGRDGAVDLVHPLHSSDNQLTLVFRSDPTVHAQGFQAVWNQTGLTCYGFPCPGHASCVTDSRTEPHCLCDFDYHGPNCTKIDNCAFVECQNGGTCVDHVGYGSCLCPPFWSGQYCQRRADPCLSFPCANGGRCQAHAQAITPDQFLCDCPPDFSPDHCVSPRRPERIVVSGSLTLHSPEYPDNYPRNFHELLILSAPPNGRLRLQWLNLAIQSDLGGYCGVYHGRLRLWDGDYAKDFPSGGPRQIATYCGNDLPPASVSSGRSLSLAFDTGGSLLTQQGFLANVSVLCDPGWLGPDCTTPDFSTTTSICSPAELLANGQLSSPHYPGAFGPFTFSKSRSCQRTLSAAAGLRLTVNVTALDLGNDCADVYLLIQAHGLPPQKLCGSSPPADPVSSAHVTITLVAATKVTSSSAGFLLRFSSSADPCFGADCGHGRCVPTPAAAALCQCFQGWQGPHCQDRGSQTFTMCVPTFYQTTAVANGFVVSNGWPDAILNFDYCTLLLRNPEPGYTFSFRFLNMSLDADGGGGCTENFVSLYDDDYLNDNRLLGTFCGTQLPSPPRNLSSTGALSIFYESFSGPFAGKGFRLEFRSVVDHCLNATCVPNALCRNLEDGYQCVCKNGYTGPNCTVDVNECLSAPCLNGATCVNKQFSYNCVCPPGYTDKNCGTDTFCFYGLCSNGGTCNHGPDGPVCRCATGFTGAHCQTVLCGGELVGTAAQQSLSSPMLDGAYPDNADCEWRLSADPSLLLLLHLTAFHLERTDYQTLTCINDYLDIWRNASGNSFSLFNGLDDLAPRPDYTLCGDGVPSSLPYNITALGTTMRLRFHSDWSVHYSGFRLNYSAVGNLCASSPCPAKATCAPTVGGFVCTCLPGWVGPQCNTSFDDCASAPCANGATCVDRERNYTCVCPHGFDGLNCQNNINECRPNPCANYGTCRDGVADFTCDCRAGLTGKTCEDCIGGTLSQLSGTIQSPLYPYLNYPRNIRCVWRIAPLYLPIGERSGASLSFAAFDVGDVGVACAAGDSLTILNPDTATNTSLCNAGFGPCSSTPRCDSVFVASSNFSLVLRTGPATARKHTGFSLSYQIREDVCGDYPCVHGGSCSVVGGVRHCACPDGWHGGSCETPTGSPCGGTIHNVSATAIDSPLYPGRYLRDELCVWDLVVPNGDLASLRWTQFDIEGSFAGCYDSLTVLDVGKNVSLGKFCDGHPLPNPLQSHSDHLRLIFASDGFVEEHGFQLLFRTVPNLCKAKACPPHSTCDSLANGTAACLCLPGWTGPDCSQNIDECAVQKIRCLNGGTCEDLATAGDFRCDCLPGFGDTLCGRDEWCANVSCLNGGTCVHAPSSPPGVCVCPSGFGGQRCQVAACGGVIDGSQTASGRLAAPLDPTTGLLVPGLYCQWTLIAPESQVVHVLVDFLDLTPAALICTEDSLAFFSDRLLTRLLRPPGVLCGYRGPFELTSPANELALELISSPDPPGPHKGFSARFVVDANDCRPFPCPNPQGQLCQDLRNNSFVCLCRPGFDGPDCRNNINDCTGTSCLNGGTCVDGIANFTCQCPPGFSGPRCYSKAQHCSPNPCLNGGTCVNSPIGFSCVCPTSALYTVSGTNCSSLACRNATLRGLSGALGSPAFLPAYPAGLSCAWTLAPLHAPPNAVVALRFTRLALEGPIGNCVYDSVSVYSGPWASAAGLEGRFCGAPASLPPLLVLHSAQALVTFATDASVTAPGFALSYTVQPLSACLSAPCENGGTCVASASLTAGYNCSCPDGYFGNDCQTYLPNSCNDDFTSLSGGFSSPAYPQGTRSPIQCEWKITMPTRNSSIALHFESFDIGGYHFLNCATGLGKNALELYGASPPSNVLVPLGPRLCGSSLATPDLSVHFPQLLIRFTKPRNFLQPHDGFAVTWAQDLCTMKGVKCGPGADCVNRPGQGNGYACQCKPGLLGAACFDNSVCANVSLRGGVGTFASPRFPDLYTNDAACSWAIAAPPATAVSLTIEFIQLEGIFPGCLEDQLSFYSSLAQPPSAVNKLTTFCGTAGSGASVVSESGEMLVTFTSDASIVRKGFEARYNLVPLGCANYACLNGGTCLGNPLDGAPVCACPAGFSGNFCEADTFCTAGVCGNGGTCGHGASGPVCVCAQGYIGARCEHRQCSAFLYAGQSLASPNFPRPYPKDLDCRYLISGPKAGLGIAFSALSLEYSPGCTADYVAVYRGWAADPGALVGRFCDSAQAPAIVGAASASQLLLLFHSDHSTANIGFNASVVNRLSCSDVACQNGGSCVATNASVSCHCPLGFRTKCSCPDGYFGNDCQTYLPNSCNDDFTSLSGGFSSPAYPQGTRSPIQCEWKITMPTRNSSIALHFESFDIGGYHFLNCATGLGKNALELYGASPPSNVLVPLGPRLCGSSLATPDLSVHFPQLLIRFTKPRNFLQPHDGFAVTWAQDLCTMKGVKCGPGADCVNRPGQGNGYACQCKPGLLGAACFDNSVCANVSLRGGVGTFASPRFPDLYTNDAACSWAIAAPPATAVSLTIEFIQLEGIFPGCLEDQLSFYSSLAQPPSAVNKLTTFCGTAGSGASVVSESGEMLVTFTSDASIVRKGFEARYNLVPLGCANYACLNGGTCLGNPLDGAPVCACPAGFSGNFCEADTFCTAGVCGNGGTCGHGASGPVCVCAQGYIGARCEHRQCSAFLYAGQSLASPNFPRPYPKDLDCRYLISGPKAGLGIAFSALSLEYSPGCTADYVAVYRGWAADPGALVGRFCDSAQAPAIVGAASASQLLLLFHSDHSTANIGFNASVVNRLSCSDVACQNGGSCVATNASVSCHCPLGFSGALCERQSCGLNQTVGASGVFTSIGYPKAYPADASCLYTLRRPAGSALRLDLDVDVEGNYDFVEVFDGLDLYAPRLQKITGVVNGLSFLSSGPAVTVFITSDASYQYKGFRANFTSVATVTNITVAPSSVGLLASSEGTRSKWLAWRQIFYLSAASPTASALQLNFSSFRTLDSGSCLRNYLDAYSLRDGRLLKRLCGVLAEPLVDLPEAAARLVWNLEDFSALHGFAASVQGFQNACAKVKCPYYAECRNSQQGAKCVCRPGPDFADCPVDCGGNVSVAQAGFLSSPRYPDVYTNDEDCRWTLTAPPGLVVQAQVTIFGIETSISSNCGFDALSFLDSDGSSLGRFCGAGRGLTVTSSGGGLGVAFRTDGTTVGSGWSLRYSAVPAGCDHFVCQNGGTCEARGGGKAGFTCACPPGFTGPFCLTDSWCAPRACLNGGHCTHVNGGTCHCPPIFTGPKCQDLANPVVNVSSLPATVTSPGFPAEYPSSVQQLTRFLLPSGTKSHMVFTAFDLETPVDCAASPYDSLVVRDASGNDIPRFCGQQLPPTLNLVGPVSVRFESDYSLQRGGFSASLSGGWADCSAAYCAHGGTCAVEASQLACACPPGFGGFRCQTDLLCQEVHCANGGTCVHRAGKGVCQCPPYTTDFQCRSVLCGGDLRGQAVGTISSPGYPSPYPAYADCVWELGDGRQQLQLTFVALDIASVGEDCSTNALIIEDGGSETRLCGHDLPGGYAQNTANLTLRFVSGPKATDDIAAGFQLFFAPKG